MLARLDWAQLNGPIERYFEIRIECRANDEWVAIDGKALRGVRGPGPKQSVILAISHQSRTVLAQAPMAGAKDSEMTVVRQLLSHAALAGQKITLDAHHCNPKTTAQIQRAQGQYLIQVKANQPTLLNTCQQLATRTPRAAYHQRDKAHGRITTRHLQGFSLNGCPLAKRWAHSGRQTLVTVERQTHTPATEKTSRETAYYITNQTLGQTPKTSLHELGDAIRQHGHVESENWIRDVTFNEDQVITHSTNQAQIMGCLRGLAIRLLRKLNVGNFQEAIDNFVDCPSTFINFLKNLRFL